MIPMRAWLYALLMLALSVTTFSCGGPKLPYDPARAAQQTIDPTPTAAPNDAEWKLIYDAVKATKQIDARMPELVRTKQCPVLVKMPTREWCQRLHYLLGTVLAGEYNRTVSSLSLDPKNKADLQHKADVIAVHDKWAIIYNNVVEPYQDQIEGWALPKSIHPLEE